MSQYDEAAVSLVVSLENAILRLHPPHQGEFIAILNAIEAHIEEQDASPEVVNLLGQALLELGRYRHLPVEHLRQLERKLAPIHARLRPQSDQR